jgi:hypothetical protein
MGRLRANKEREASIAKVNKHKNKNRELTPQ